MSETNPAPASQDENNLPPVNETVIIENESKEKDLPPVIDEKNVKPKSRFTQAANFSPSENDYLLSVLDARKNNKDKNGNPAPLTKDLNQLIRQCIDFAFNSRKDAPKLTFAIPDNIPVEYFKNGFFDNNNTK